jgi:hypothetical protein
MKITLRNIDRRAALLAGHEVGPIATIDAAPADFGDAWPDVVASLTLNSDGSAICQARQVAAPTIEAVIAAVAADKVNDAVVWAEVLADAETAITILDAIEPKLEEQTVFDPYPNVIGRMPLLRMPAVSHPSMYDSRVTETHRADPIWARLQAAFDRKNQMINAANEAAKEAALPRLRAEKAKADRLAQEAAETEAAEKKAALAALGAERLKTGYWERGTNVYNPRREGKPWCARLTLNAATGQLDYAWGEWIGRVGEEGVLRLACRPGDVIAWGQKDFKRANKSVHQIQRMKDDGLMENLTTVEAVWALRA